MISKLMAVVLTIASIGSMIAIPGLMIAQQQRQQPAYAQLLDGIIEDVGILLNDDEEEEEEEEDESNTQEISQPIEQEVEAEDTEDGEGASSNSDSDSTSSVTDADSITTTTVTAEATELIDQDQDNDADDVDQDSSANDNVLVNENEFGDDTNEQIAIPIIEQDQRATQLGANIDIVEVEEEVPTPTPTPTPPPDDGELPPEEDGVFCFTEDRGAGLSRVWCAGTSEACESFEEQFSGRLISTCQEFDEPPPGALCFTDAPGHPLIDCAELSS